MENDITLGEFIDDCAQIMKGMTPIEVLEATIDWIRKSPPPICFNDRALYPFWPNGENKPHPPEKEGKDSFDLGTFVNVCKKRHPEKTSVEVLEMVILCLGNPSSSH